MFNFASVSYLHLCFTGVKRKRIKMLEASGSWERDAFFVCMCVVALLGKEKHRFRRHDGAVRWNCLQNDIETLWILLPIAIGSIKNIKR